MTLEQVIIKGVKYFTPDSLVGAKVYYGNSLIDIRDHILENAAPKIVEGIFSSKYKFNVNGSFWQYAVPKFLIDDWKRKMENDLTFAQRWGLGNMDRRFLSEEEVNKNFRIYANGLPLSEITCLDILTNKPSELIIKLAKEKNMNAVKVNYWNDVTERFESKDYTFLVEGEYKEGDYLVFRNYDGNLATVKVVSFITDLSTLPLGINYKDMVVLGKADMSPYQAMVDKKEREARKAEILEELESKFEEANKMALYKELAKKDKDMADLLKELEGLDK